MLYNIPFICSYTTVNVAVVTNDATSRKIKSPIFPLFEAIMQQMILLQIVEPKRWRRRDRDTASELKCEVRVPVCTLIVRMQMRLIISITLWFILL